MENDCLSLIEYILFILYEVVDKITYLLFSHMNYYMKYHIFYILTFQEN